MTLRCSRDSARWRPARSCPLLWRQLSHQSRRRLLESGEPPAERIERDAHRDPDRVDAALGAARHCVLARQQGALPAQAVQKLMKGDVDRLTVEPGVELSVEERIRAAVDEGHYRSPIRGGAELGVRREEPLGGKVRRTSCSSSPVSRSCMFDSEGPTSPGRRGLAPRRRGAVLRVERLEVVALVAEALALRALHGGLVGGRFRRRLQHVCVALERRLGDGGVGGPTEMAMTAIRLRFMVRLLFKKVSSSMWRLVRGPAVLPTRSQCRDFAPADLRTVTASSCELCTRAPPEPAARRHLRLLRLRFRRATLTASER